MIVSGGVLVKSPQLVWSGTPSTWGTWPSSLELNRRWSSYAEIYKQQLWVAVLVNKLARAKARLPLKVYERAAQGRPEARDHPYAVLLRRPNRRWSPFFTWLWTSSTYDVYGESFLGKIRDRGGRPVQLVPMHPVSMHADDERDGRVMWTFQNGRVRIDGIPDEDLLHLRTYNPDSVIRGLSPLEPLRRSLENEDSARRAATSFWKNGARPGVVLTHPGSLSQKAADRLKLRWNQIAAGADNYGTTVVLEEGMKPEVLTLSAEESQFIQSHKMHTEEACAIYDVPPPVVHILDNATYSNITEQMRSMYRDTMAPRLKSFEAELEAQLRSSVRPGRSEPDFGDDVYAEYLLDEVLRGDFETRMEAKQKAINSGQMTPAEAREMENMPFIPGSDRLFINSTMIPLAPSDDDARGSAEFAADVGLAVQRLGLGVNYGVLSAEEARTFLPGVQGPAPTLEPAAPTAEEMRMVMGRLSRQKSLDEVDPEELVAGLNGSVAIILAEFDAAKDAGLDVAGFRRRLRALSVKE